MPFYAVQWSIVRNGVVQNLCLLIPSGEGSKDTPSCRRCDQSLLVRKTLDKANFKGLQQNNWPVTFGSVQVLRDKER